jgi:hypothetical protein
MSSQRGVVQRIERKLETTVGDAFARAFGGSIVPEEIEAMLRREAADEVRSLEGNHLLVPNEYVITLSVHDYDKTAADQDLTANAFAKHLAEFIGEQGWQTYGQVAVRFEPAAHLHTGQFRTRGDVNPDVNPPPNANNTSPPQSTHHAFSAETGVAPMTDNPSYRGNQGQGRPGDEYYDDRYGRPPHDDDRYGRSQDDPWGGQDARGGQEPRPPYPPEQGGYPPQQDQGYPPPRRPDQGGYPDQGPGGYQPPYEPRPAAGYGGQGGYDPGYRQPPQPPAGYGPPPGGPQGYGDYGRGPARPDDGGYGPPEQRPVYPEQGGGYDQGYQGGAPYGRQDYGRPDYGRYPEAPPAGYDYGQPPSGYAEPGGYDYGQPPSGYSEPGGYDYGQPPGGYGGYGGYGQGSYPSFAPGVTLQLDDGSGRTYQLTQGINVVGRGQDAQFRLPDTGVSRRHLEIRWDGRVALLSDLNSTNGTTVNNAPVQEWQLADGDVIRLGHSEIVVHVH